MLPVHSFIVLFYSIAPFNDMKEANRNLGNEFKLGYGLFYLYCYLRFLLMKFAVGCGVGG